MFCVVPKSGVKTMSKMLKTIHQERKKTEAKVKGRLGAELRAIHLKEPAKKAEDGIEEVLTYSISFLRSTE